MLQEIQFSSEFIKAKSNGFVPDAGIILGTGLGGLVSHIDVEYIIPYQEIPHFALSTVEGHKGQLILGKIGNKKVIAMQGRFHFYEGYSMEQVVFPVRVMKQLGIKQLFVSNASGGLNPDFSVGDLMIIEDHINHFPTNPLIGKNHEELGPRFPDFSEAYNKTLIQKAEAIAESLKIKVRKGVYVGLTGPCLETPAEYKYLRIIGADAVGMSTVPEIIAAVHMGLPCFGISIITDLGVPGKIKKTTLEEIKAIAELAEPKMTKVMYDLIVNC